jgi:hypothetical protein
MTEKEKLIGEMDNLIEWLPDSKEYIEKCWNKMKNLLDTSDTSDYAKCDHRNIVPGDDLFVCDDCKRVVKVTAHFIQNTKNHLD